MKKEHGQGKNKYGMVINLDKCTGCGTCMVACASENNVAVSRTSQTNSGPLHGCVFIE